PRKTPLAHKKQGNLSPLLPFDSLFLEPSYLHQRKAEPNHLQISHAEAFPSLLPANQHFRLQLHAFDLQ
ncbi:hypothetical protein, partial [Pseudomonas aeruginosa]|uniref:hypothetical protein n=1 Tax=Pseudomonas aeruginosa TaxID=287 RepID=UPI001C3ECE01